MSGDQSFKKSGSPRSSTEVSSLQVNRIKNKEALEKGLRCRRSVKELVNQGILLNPFISHPDKVRQLQRAKTSDLLKHKIEKRPDRQYLINRRIIRDDKPGTSPFILERCHSLEKHHLQSSLSSKLTTRPGSLELIEKGVLQVDPGVDSLVRCGSIQYPRVESPSPYAPLESIAESEPIPTPPPIPSSAVISPQCTNPADLGTSSANVGRTRINSTSRSSGSSSRSIREETVVYKLGSLVFHNYCPKTTHSFSPSICSSASFQQKQKAREAQQADLLRLQDTARVHRLVEQEINKRANLASHGPSPVLKLAGEIPTTSTAALFVNGQKIPGKPVDVFSPFPFSPTSTCSVETPFSVAAMSVDSAEYSLTPNPNDFSATNSPMISTPVAHLSLNINGSSVHSLESFERLTLTQLKAECRQRKLPRSGLKATLIKQLEPYANEILPKYFPDSESIPKDGAKTDQKNVSVVGSPQAVVLKSSASSPAPAPVWTAPVPSPPSSSSCSSSLTTSSQAPIFTLNGVNTNSLITASTVQNGVFVYSVSQSSASRPQLNQPTNISSLSLLNNSQTLLVQHQQQPNVVVNQCASLHHSYSAPYMIQTSSLPSSTMSPAQTQPITTVPTPIIPVRFSSCALPSNLLSSPLCNISCQTQPQVQPTTCSLTKQPTIYIASDLFSFTHAANLLSTANGRIASTGAGQPLLATTTNGVLVRSVMLNGLPSLCQQGTDAPPQHSAAGEVMVQATTTTPHATPPPPPSKALNSKKPLVHAASLSNIPSPKKQEAASGHSGQPPSLNQIEEVWLRIRQLRRLIAKERIPDSAQASEMEDAESEPKISRLISEHDRLAVLCRLLVIDRLDALDEILESGKLSDCAAKNSSDSDLLVERNLMDSYLRKLGGMALVNSVSSSSPRFRRSSTPSLVAKPPVTAANTNGSSAHVNGSLRANGVPPIPSPSIPETPCVKPAAPACPSPISCTGGNSEPQTSVDTRSHLASSWSGGLQQLQRDVTPDDDRAPMCSVPAHGECRPTRCEVSEPPPSPMTTDLLFEFWNNAIKEVGKNESTLSSESACEGKASAESQHFPNLPRQLNSTEFTFTMDTDLQDSHESETDSFQIPKRRATFLLDTDGEDLCGSKVHSEAISTNSPEAVEHGANENGWSPLFNHLTASAKSPTNSAAAASNEVRRPDFPNKSAQLTYGNVASGDNGATFSNAFSAATPFRSSPSSTSIPTQVGWASMLGTPSAHSSTTPSSLGQISTSSADSNSRKRSSYNHSYFMEDSGCFSQNSVPAATDMADALFTTFDPSDFSELMDTTESSMNWPVDV